MSQNPIAAILFREKSAEWTTLKPVKTGFEVDEHRTAEIAVEGTGLNFSAPETVAAVKVACVVTGHIVAVIAAHDRALRLLPAGHQLTGQLTMMLVMVGYTFTGLYLLFGG